MNFLEAVPYEWVLILFLHNADPALDERMVGAIESCELPVIEKKYGVGVVIVKKFF